MSITGSLLRWELEREMNQRLLTPVNTAEIQIWIDESNLISNPAGHQRGLRIVKNDAFLLIEPAWSLVDFRDDRVKAKVSDAISEYTILGIKRLSLPRKKIDEVRYFVTELCVVGDNGGALCLAVGDIADSAVRKELVELSVSQLE